MILANESMMQHLLTSLTKGIRFDGRKLTDYRQIKIEYGASKTAEGSARVKIGVGAVRHHSTGAFVMNGVRIPSHRFSEFFGRKRVELRVQLQHFR